MSEPIAMVPTLAELLAEPERIDTLPAGAVAGLVVQLADLQQRLGARLAVTGPQLPAVGGQDEVLDAEEAAARLRCSALTLRHRSKSWPYSALLSPASTRRRLRFSSARIAAYLRGELTKPGPIGSRPAQPDRRKRITAGPAPLARRGGQGGVPP